MTRTMQQRWLTHADMRRFYGCEKYTSLSCFLCEISTELLHEARSKPKNSYRMSQREQSAWVDDQHVHKSDVLWHERQPFKFGTGVVVTLEGSGDYVGIQIHFSEVGNQWLVLAYANLTLL